MDGWMDGWILPEILGQPYGIGILRRGAGGVSERGMGFAA
ncbi:hypothetical protein SNOG_13981 [Parastagonospora nodorum SN15]|uniref:Uncharacterized protein n=1 Tax=Phaeosphaeria nodorum (strain SN15 / ATCC MYA-4574 / FGSC 10173) TaxID=321614 RepID=Q0U2V5_PHANO|nr:hypothetical protein SNOG_13981 [Parastagonospora nodorum SN15]EAT78606.1 hypothetical protein SNOG_13981 [Parastagonospora nodorum SN15]